MLIRPKRSDLAQPILAEGRTLKWWELKNLGESNHGQRQKRESGEIGLITNLTGISDKLHTTKSREGGVWGRALFRSRASTPHHTRRSKKITSKKLGFVQWVWVIRAEKPFKLHDTLKTPRNIRVFHRICSPVIISLRKKLKKET